MTKPSVRVSVLRLLSIALILVLVMNWVGHKLRESIDNQKPKVAEDWPTTLPQENHRVHSLDGLSIIAPANWRASITESSIQIVAPQVPPGFLKESEIEVKRVCDPFRHPQPLPCTTQFQDGPACMKIVHVRSTHLEPIRHEAIIVVEREGQQYEIIFRSYKHFTKHVPDRVLTYLETFELADTNKSLTAALQ